MQTIKGVKGFDKNLKCRDFQYEIGCEYETTDKPVRCTSHGFHFCENPLDVFGYYPPNEGNRFAKVEGGGDVSRDDSDSKVAVSKIKIGGEITIHALVGLAVKWIFEKVDWKNAKESNTGDRSAATNTGYRSAATNTGYGSAATNTGNRSAATNTGDRSAASVEGKDSIACGLGRENTASGALGCWIVLAEWEEKEDGYYAIKSVKTAKVDGKKIKAGVFYKLVNGKFIEA